MTESCLLRTYLLKFSVKRSHRNAAIEMGAETGQAMDMPEHDLQNAQIYIRGEGAHEFALRSGRLFNQFSASSSAMIVRLPIFRARRRPSLISL
ncbi:MAG TPA: hypothetical protein VNX23_01985 [Bradyrhizobium sp.]|nr:hypothetical protein [Bradyrhizobium sp.]